jgi:V/A-type H+-transporting ATPase subunit A
MGIITGISGPTISVDMKGLSLYERVFVGHAMLTGEVVRIKEDGAVIQVYEDTRGLAFGEPVLGTGKTLMVSLGPGLLKGIFDGLQRPLQRLRDESGSLIRQSKGISAIDMKAEWRFYPLKKEGDSIKPGESIGYVEEGNFKHLISLHDNAGGRISRISEGDFSLEKPVATLDSGYSISCLHEWPARAPRPYRRKFPPSEPLVTGQRVIDFLFSVAKGGAAILPGGFGTGKTILEQSVAKFADVDIVVYVGCGERGNEMAEMIEEFELLKDPWTKKKLMERTILCINTSNMPVAAREASIYTAIAMAEYYRDMGLNVLFLADSISRWAEALREISTSLEEMPGEEGYPTYLASRLSGFIERAGVVETLNGKKGSLTMMLAVSPPGGDLTEPVTQSCLRTTGAFLMLDTSLAHRRHFPSINWSQSYSLYGRDLLTHFKDKISPEWEAILHRCREILQDEEKLREVVEIIGVEGLQDADRLLIHVAEMIRLEFLCQNAYSEDAFSPPEKTLSIIRGLLDFYETSSGKLAQGIMLEEILAETKRGVIEK